MTTPMFIVEQSIGGASPLFSVHLWKPGEKLPKPVWTAGVNPEKTRFHEVPHSYLAVDNTLFLGLSSGCIDAVRMDTGGKTARYGPRPQPSNIRDPYYAKIVGLAFFEGAAYDASYAGLFKTTTGELVDDRQIGTLETAIGRLLIVPRGTNPTRLEGRDYTTPRSMTNEHGTFTFHAPDMFRFADSARESHAGDLVDAISKEIVMKGVEPFDGSGMSPGNHLVAGDKLYMHHGNYPGERITIRGFPSGKFQGIVGLITTGPFVEHDGRVYDARSCPSEPENDRGERSTRILASDEDYHAPSESLFDVPHGERIVSMASGGTRGLLIALYNQKKNASRVISHLEPAKPLLKSKGRLAVYRV